MKFKNKVYISALKNAVDFPDLLIKLGFKNVNIIKNRASCLLHGGNNITSFNWNNDYYYCFSCLARGDKIDLIMQIKHCNFKEALNYLSHLTGLTVQSESNKLEFPTYIKFDMKKKIHNKAIRDIEQKIETYTDILISMRNSKTPYLYSFIEKKLNQLDEELSWWSYYIKRNKRYYYVNTTP